MKTVAINLRVEVEVHQGEGQDEVFKHLCSILYNADPDVKNVEEVPE